MKSLLLFAFIIFGSISLSFTLQAQDERFFRDIYSGNLEGERKKEQQKAYHYDYSSPIYQLDIDGDGKLEGLLYHQRDGESWFEIVDNQGLSLAKFHLDVYGKDARPYRVNLRSLDENTKVLVLAFYEGNVNYLNFEGTSRLYFISLDNNKFKTLKIFKGPIVFEEGLDFKKNYFRRTYVLDFPDINKDGCRDIVVRHHGTSRAYIYLGEGKWSGQN